jgi:ElaB/YqjD/DUF883 family membrane-anchored ribosome-binding protein
MTQQKTGYPMDHGAEAAKGRLGNMADAATDKMKDVADSSQEMASKVADQAMEFGGKVQDAAKQVRPFMEKSMKEQPMATLAAIAAVGFVLGALWKK